jgi:hypothetical protein
MGNHVSNRLPADDYVSSVIPDPVADCTCRLQPSFSPPASLKTLRTQRVAGEYGFPLSAEKAKAFYVSPSQRNIKKLSSLRPLRLCGALSFTFPAALQNTS